METSLITSDNHGLKLGVGGTRALAHFIGSGQRSNFSTSARSFLLLIEAIREASFSWRATVATVGQDLDSESVRYSSASVLQMPFTFCRISGKTGEMARSFNLLQSEGSKPLLQKVSVEEC